MEVITKKQSKTDALSVTRYLLFLDSERKYFDTEVVKNKYTSSVMIRGNFRLNQILYLLRILYHLNYKKILFDDKIYAWEHGMIFYSVYSRFWELYWQDDKQGEKAIKNEEIKGFINRMFDFLKTIPDENLQAFVYNDPAWYSTWAKISEPSIDFAEEKYFDNHQRVYSRLLQKVVA